MNGIKRQITVPEFVEFKQQSHLIMLTAYDFVSADPDEAWIDAILVDHREWYFGYDTTLPVTLDDIIYHAEIVGRCTSRLVVADFRSQLI